MSASTPELDSLAAQIRGDLLQEIQAMNQQMRLAAGIRNDVLRFKAEITDRLCEVREMHAQAMAVGGPPASDTAEVQDLLEAARSTLDATVQHLTQADALRAKLAPMLQELTERADRLEAQTRQLEKAMLLDRDGPQTPSQRRSVVDTQARIVDLERDAKVMKICMLVLLVLLVVRYWWSP